MKNILIILILLFIRFNIYGQDSLINKNKYWVDIGVGGYKCKSSHGNGFQTSFNYSKSNKQFKLQGSFVKENYANLFDPLVSGPYPREYFYDFSVLFGRVLFSNLANLSVLTGLSIFGGVQRGRFLYTYHSGGGGFGGFNFDFPTQYYENQKIITIGLPLEADLLFKLSKYFGLGIDCSMDINLKKTDYMISSKIIFGKIK